MDIKLFAKNEKRIVDNKNIQSIYEKGFLHRTMHHENKVNRKKNK